MAEDSDLTKQQKESHAITETVDQFMQPTHAAAAHSVTYRWKSDIGTKMYIIVGVDEFGVICSMFISMGSSGTQMHNISNALGRVISLCIQNDKATLMEIVQTLEDFSSEQVWMSDTLGRAKSVPAVIALILERHLRVEEILENMHSGIEEDADVHEDNHGENH